MRSLSSSGGNMNNRQPIQPPPLVYDPNTETHNPKYPIGTRLPLSGQSRVGNHGRIITTYGKAIVFQGKITRVTGSGWGYLPYVGENPQAIQEQVALFNQMRAAGASNREIGIAMRNLAAKWRGKIDVHVQGTPPPTIIEE